MKVVIASDSMKGSLSSREAGEAIRQGVLRAVPDAETVVYPVADGGEGTVEALTEGMEGTFQIVSVTGPLGEKVKARYGILKDGKTAVMEMSAAAGITLLSDQELNPLKMTTYGVGEMIRDAIHKGCRHFLIGIGGSATNDGGVGMLQALGYGMLDREGKQIPFGASGLESLNSITQDSVIPELKECHFRIACDVSNPLCGKTGASAVFGPQKGASPADVEKMDGWLTRYGEKVRKINPMADPETSGAGAAGGLGFAFLAFTKAVLEPGIQMVLEETGMEESVKDADLVITGEGCLDSQTVMGKVPVGVAGLAKKYRKPVLAFAGSVSPDAGICNAYGIDAYFPIVRRIQTLQEAMEPENARRNLTDAVEQALRLVVSCGKG